MNDVIEFGSLHAAAVQDAARLLRNFEPENSSARILVAAAALACARNPTDYARYDIRTRVVDKIVAAQSPGARFRGGGDARPADALIEASDRAAGALLLRQLRPTSPT